MPNICPSTAFFAEMDVLRASGSMPFFAQPVPWQGRRYLDGGVADSIPYEAMGRLGYDRRVVILTRDLEYRKKPMPQAAVRAMYGKYPVFCQRLLNRHTVYNASVARLAALEKAGEIFVLSALAPHYRAPAGAGSGGAAGGLRPGGKGRPGAPCRPEGLSFEIRLQ